MFSAPSYSEALVGSDVVAEIVPEIPSPNEQVTIKLTSYAIDLNSSLITWKVSGKTVLPPIFQVISELFKSIA